jgi:hypothetical protein
VQTQVLQEKKESESKKGKQLTLTKGKQLQVVFMPIILSQIKPNQPMIATSSSPSQHLQSLM